MRSLGRWLTLVVLLLDAVVLATLELFFLPLRFDGRLLPDVGSWPFPITVLFAAVGNPWLTARAGELSQRTVVAVAPMLAWLAAIAVFGLVGVENMVLIQDWRTLLLIAAGTLPTALVLGTIAGERRSEQLDPV